MFIWFGSKYNVVPHAGTWIEIITTVFNLFDTAVVPHAGTWIEIKIPQSKLLVSLVVPHAGTWIEIVKINPPFMH